MAKKSDYPVFDPFNPLDKRHLGASVANALLESEVYPLPPKPFIGAGVYALYYLGDFPAYEVLAEVNRNGQYAAPFMWERQSPMAHGKADREMMLIPEPLCSNGLQITQNQ